MSLLYVAVQLLSHVEVFATPWTAACQASLSFTISRNLLKLMSSSFQFHSGILKNCTESWVHSRARAPPLFFCLCLSFVKTTVVTICPITHCEIKEITVSLILPSYITFHPQFMDAIIFHLLKVSTSRYVRISVCCGPH